jgi:type II secretion system protein N
MMTSKRVVFPIAIGLILVFVLLLFPWESLARRVAWEISVASGGRVEISTLAPALTARGPVLRARNVLIEHPAIDRILLAELELAPRRILQWLTGVPTLRVWTTSELGIIDGVLGLGTTLSFDGSVHQVELARLPLRLDASGVDLSGQLDGVAGLTLDPDGTLHGRMTFECASLVVASNTLPMAIPFSRAEGVIEILESGATRIESLSVEGDVLEGDLSGEIGLVHHSQSPPVDLKVKMRIVDPGLRQLAPGAGIPMSANGELDLQISGTLDRPRFESSQTQSKRQARPARGSRRERNQ